MAYAQGKSDKAIADYNAAIAEQNAEQARRAAEVSARDTRDATRRQLGSMRAAYGTSGVVTTEGSPLVALVDQAE